jgi:hypothetical protein
MPWFGLLASTQISSAGQPVAPIAFNQTAAPVGLASSKGLLPRCCRLLVKCAHDPRELRFQLRLVREAELPPAGLVAAAERCRVVPATTTSEATMTAAA